MTDAAVGDKRARAPWISALSRSLASLFPKHRKARESIGDALTTLARGGLLLRSKRVVGDTFLIRTKVIVRQLQRNSKAKDQTGKDLKDGALRSGRFGVVRYGLLHPKGPHRNDVIISVRPFFSYSLKSITAETPTPSTRFTFVILMLSMGISPLMRAILLNLNSSCPTAFTLSTWAFGPTTWTAPI